MKAILVLSLIALSRASPLQADDTKGEFDQEAIYDTNPEFPLRSGDDPTKSDDYDYDAIANRTSRPTILEVIIGRPMMNPFMFPWRSLIPMRPTFPLRPTFPFGHSEDYYDSDGSSAGDFFSDTFDTRFGSPNMKDLPPNYENSTYEVKDINGTKVHINQTINKKSEDGFDSFFHVKVIKVEPEYQTDELFPTERIPHEKTPESEAEIPTNVDDSLNQLDSKQIKPFRDDGIDVRKEVSL